MEPAKLEIRLLGPLEARAAGNVLELPPSKKARALLAYLATSGRAHTRAALCGLFWPEVNDPRAGLRWAVYKLRAALEGDARNLIRSDRDQLLLKMHRAEVDLHRIRSLVGDNPETTPTRSLKDAAEAFRGEFIEGLDVPGCHEYETWCLGTRERIRSLRLAIHGTLVDRLRDDPESALPYAFDRVALDPFSDEAHLAVMELLADAGRVQQALELYERYRRTLADELGVSPSEELETARRRLSMLPRRSSPAQGDRPRGDPNPDELVRSLSHLPAPEHLSEPAADEPPLVGRSTVVETLTTEVARAGTEGAGSVILVAGEPGVGKTRLLRELVRRVRSSGGWVLAGQLFETEEVRPYGPWIELLLQAPEAAVDGEIRKGLSGFFDEPGSRSRRGGATERAQIFDAATRLLEHLAKARKPALVVLDDVQWLDASSAALLHYAARKLASTPLIFALGAREEEISRGSATARVLRSLETAGRLRRIRLDRLSASDTEALVWAVDPELDPDPVLATSEGNPLFALALARSLRDGVHHVPTSIDEGLRDRLERLSSEARSLLPWAAALGRTFDVATLVSVLDRSAAEIVEAVGELERRGILRATGSDRYDFTHSLLRQAAYGDPSEPVRRQIHRSIATTLDARGESRTPEAVAHHAERGGLPDLAASAYAEAAEGFLWVFAYDEAAEMLRRGLAQVEALSGEVRTRRELGLLRIYGFRGMEDHRPEDLEARVEEVTEEARRRRLPHIVAQGHSSLMELQYQRGAYGEAQQSALLSAEAGREGDSTTAISALAETAACLLILDQAPEDARRLASEAFRLAEEQGTEVKVVPLAAALLHHRDGELEAASRAFEEVVRLARHSRDRWWELSATTRRAMVELDRGEPERARARAREGEVLAQRMGDEVEGAFARGLAAVARARLERGAGADPPRNAELDGVDESVRALRDLDSLWKIAQLQAYAADLQLGDGKVAAARARAREAFEAGRTLDRPSLRALARALLARCAATEGDRKGAAAHLESPEIKRPEHPVSHRAQQAIREARKAMGRVRQG